MTDSAISRALDRRVPLRVPHEVVLACAGILQRVNSARPGVASIAVTSARPGEGRSTVAAGLAIAAATMHGVRTVLIAGEADPEPGPHPPSGRRGFPDPLEREDARVPTSLDVGQAIEVVVPNLGVLPVSRVIRPGGTWSPAAAGAMIQQVQAVCSLVVADLPALPPHGTAERLAASFDVVIVVVRAGSTPLDVVSSATGALPNPPLIVLNAVSTGRGPRWLSRRGSR